jgi:hypothetical protein
MDKNPINPVTHAYRRYYVEFGVSMTAYVAMIFVSRWLLRGPMQHANEERQIGIAVLPLIPTCFVFAAIVRCVRGVDEMLRRVYVESLAIAGGATALIAVTYGLMESDRVPHLSAWWTYTTFMVAWIVAGVFVRRRYQ